MADITNRRSVWWKVYFYLIIILSIFGIIFVFLGIFIMNKEITLRDIIEFPLDIAFLIGLYGYVFSKKILWQKFWVFIILIDIADTIYYYFFSGTNLLMLFSPEVYLYINIFNIISLIPMYIGLILYSLPSNKLWSEPSNKNEVT